MEHTVYAMKQRFRLTAAILLLSAGGCAGRAPSAAEEQVRVLTREVAALKSERALAEARAGALDDKMLLLKTRLKKCETSSSPALQVVKLTPGGSESTVGEGDSAFVQTKEAAFENNSNGSSKRPVLVLGPKTRASRRAPTTNRPAAGPLLGSSDFEHLGADNLGVVSDKERTDLPQGAMALFNNAYREYSNKQYSAALDGFAEFIKAEPGHAFADDAVYWRGECYLAQGKFLYAVGEFERLMRRYPSSEKVSSGLYRIGFAYDKLRDYAKAAEYYFEVVDKFPGSDAARRASSRVAEINSFTAAGGSFVPTSATR